MPMTATRLDCPRCGDALVVYSDNGGYHGECQARGCDWPGWVEIPAGRVMSGEPVERWTVITETTNEGNFLEHKPRQAGKGE